MIEKKKICVICGNEILNRNKKYCSYNCRPESYYQKVKLREMICLECGKPFKSKIKRKYCGSDDCMEKVRIRDYNTYREKNGFKLYKEVIEKKCLQCGKSFLTSHSRHQWCSPKCKWKAQKERNKLGISLLAGTIKTCVICGKKFSGQNNKYCSRTCHLNRNIRTEPDGTILKKCTKCGEFKPATEENFESNKNSIHGLTSHCKTCKAEKHKKYMATNHAKKLRAIRDRRSIDTIRKYREKNLPKRRKAEAIRRRTDIAFVLKNRMRSLIYSSLRGNKNGRSLQELTGYSVEDLRQHIGKQFKDGMSWKQFLAGEIHIDHKIPVSVFNFSKPEDTDFKRCWALSNLQPLWTADNISKYDKLKKPFQPSMF